MPIYQFTMETDTSIIAAQLSNRQALIEGERLKYTLNHFEFFWLPAS